MSQDFFDLSAQLVPSSGQASTIQGEVLRAINKLANDFVSNGYANWDDGYERLSAFALRHLADGTFGPKTTAGIRSDIEQTQAYGRGENISDFDFEAAFGRLMLASVAWCQRNADPIPHNPDPKLKR